jgi:hypothetical protein
VGEGDRVVEKEVREGGRGGECGNERRDRVGKESGEEREKEGRERERESVCEKERGE